MHTIYRGVIDKPSWEWVYTMCIYIYYIICVYMQRKERSGRINKCGNNSEIGTLHLWRYGSMEVPYSRVCYDSSLA